VPDWRPVELGTWHELSMVLRSVLLELPPGTELLLGPDDDDRVAHVSALPQPHVEIRTSSGRLASLPCRTVTDAIDHLEKNIHDHWEVSSPERLSVAFDGPVDPRLSRAFVDGELVSDLPEPPGQRPGQHSTGETHDRKLGEQLDQAQLDRLRRMSTDR
jgi:hypothetical protein